VSRRRRCIAHAQAWRGTAPRTNDSQCLVSGKRALLALANSRARETPYQTGNLDHPARLRVLTGRLISLARPRAAARIKRSNQSCVVALNLLNRSSDGLGALNATENIRILEPERSGASGLTQTHHHCRAQRIGPVVWRQEANWPQFLDRGEFCEPKRKSRFERRNGNTSPN